MKKDKDILKKGMEKTSADFTSHVMDSINKEEKALNNVLNEHGRMITSESFTVNVMQQLEGKTPAIPYEPVISRSVWLAICAVFVGIVVLVITTGTPIGSKLTAGDSLKIVAESIGSFFSNLGYTTYTAAGIFVLSLGLLVEQKINRG